jgi:hypothetical protein
MKVAVVVAAALALVACQSPTNQSAAAPGAGRPGKPTVEQLVAARQGPEVNQVCFASQINGWSALGDKAVLVEMRLNDWYKLDLSGDCQPQWAFNAIKIRSFPGSDCISRGDRLTTDDRAVRGVCFVNAIHKWNYKAPVGPAPAAASAGASSGAHAP